MGDCSDSSAEHGGRQANARCKWSVICKPEQKTQPTDSSTLPSQSPTPHCASPLESPRALWKILPKPTSSSLPPQRGCWRLGRSPELLPTGPRLVLWSHVDQTRSPLLINQNVTRGPALRTNGEEAHQLSSPQFSRSKDTGRVPSLPSCTYPDPTFYTTQVPS